MTDVVGVFVFGAGGGAKVVIDAIDVVAREVTIGDGQLSWQVV